MDGATAEGGFDSITCEMLEGALCWDARDPLHDIESADPRDEDEIATCGQLLRIERIERELGGLEVTQPVVRRVERAQNCRQALEVARIGSGDDVDVLRGSRKAVRSHREPADQDVPHASVGQRGYQLIWSEHPGGGASCPRALRRFG